MAHPTPDDRYTAVIALIRRVEINLKLSDPIKSCANLIQSNPIQSNPIQIIDLALSLGFEFSREDLSSLGSLSKDLCADYFPWAGQGEQRARAVFLSHLFTGKEIPLPPR